MARVFLFLRRLLDAGRPLFGRAVLVRRGVASKPAYGSKTLLFSGGREWYERQHRAFDDRRFSFRDLCKGLLAFVTGWGLVFAALHCPSLAQPAFRYANQLVEQQIRYADWETVRSEHFALSYLPADEPYVSMILNEAEAVYETFAEQFRFAPEQTLPLVLFSGDQQMQERFGWPAAQKASGVYYGGVIYLMSPRALWPGDYETALNEGQLADWYHEEGPLFHEYTHWYLDAMANNNFPRWYTEGLAQLVEYEMIGYEWLSDANRLNEQPLYTFGELDAAFDELENVALAYRQAFKWVQYVSERHGREKMQAFHQRLAQAVPFERAWEEVFGEPVEASFNHWREDVRRGGYE